MTDDSAALDLEAYLERIHYDGPLQPDAEVLQALHLAHACRIPFENLDILLGKAIALDLGSLQQKLVAGSRGGYCFEQNRLFAAVLERLGFEVQTVAARVRYRSTRVQPRTHMALLVEVRGTGWLADVGFGGEGLLLPVRMQPGVATRQGSWTYRIVPEGRYRVLQSLHGDEWMDLYAFTDEPQFRVDFELANYYMSTHPESRFARTLTAQLPAPERRLVLRNLELTEDTGGRASIRRLSDGDELLQVLAEGFGLQFPRGTRFAFDDAG